MHNEEEEERSKQAYLLSIYVYVYDDACTSTTKVYDLSTRKNMAKLMPNRIVLHPFFPISEHTRDVACLIC